jgi:hypothetical protein
MNFVEMLLMLVMLLVNIALLMFRETFDTVEIPELPMLTGPNWAFDVDT